MRENTCTRRSCLTMLAGSAVLKAQESGAEALDFLHGLSEYEKLPRMLPDYMEREGQRAVAARRSSLKLATVEDVARRRQYVREHILQAIGGLPERTPLNPRTIATMERQGYRIEKIIFESQPNFFVTANLYLPASGKAAIPRRVCIHWGMSWVERRIRPGSRCSQLWLAKATWRLLGIPWDKASACRSTILTCLGRSCGALQPSTRSRASNAFSRDSTSPGTRSGTQCGRWIICCRARKLILNAWSCTGNSGGGTHTAYLSALDDRIKVAAPSCYITSWHWMLKTLGPQDAEQVFPGWLADGLDYPDFLYAVAPKPYLVLSAIRDFFPIDGARESFAEAKGVYTALGQPDKLKMFEADDGHGYSHPRRLAAYEWFARWTHSGDEAPSAEVQIQPGVRSDTRLHSDRTCRDIAGRRDGADAEPRTRGATAEEQGNGRRSERLESSPGKDPPGRDHAQWLRAAFGLGAYQAVRRH